MKYSQNAIKKICNNRYLKNMKVLKGADETLYNRVVNYKIENKYRFHVYNENIYNVFIPELDKYFYEKDNMLYQVKLEIDKFEVVNAKMVVFFGMGLGYELLYFLKELAKIHQTKKIIVFEKNFELFINALYAVDFTSIFNNKHIKFLVGLSEKDVAKFFDIYFRDIETISLVKAMQILYYPTSMEMNKDYYLSLFEIYKESIQYSLKYFGNSPEDSLIGIEHMFRNIKEIVEHPGINLLYNQFAEKPCLVVASGPSLKKNIHLIKQIKDDVLIISAQSTLKILLKHGIKPNIVATLERVQETALSFEGLKEDEVQDVFLAACPVIPPKAYEAYKGPRLVVYRRFDHFKWLEIEKGMLDIKLSSANMAFRLGIELGCNPIILVGQDLAFGDNKRTHIDGHVMGTEQENYQKDRIVEVPGNDGETVLTSATWLSFLKSYEMDIRDYQGKCINATEGGAYIKGTEVMTLKEAIEKYIREKTDAKAIISKSIKHFENTDVEKEYKRIFDKLCGAIEDIDFIIKKADEAVLYIEEEADFLETIFNKKRVSDFEEKKLKEIYSKTMSHRVEMLSYSETFQLLIMHVVQPIFLKYDIDMHEIPKKYPLSHRSFAKTIMFMQKWFVVIRDIIVRIEDELLNTKEILSIREEEND